MIRAIAGVTTVNVIEAAKAMTDRKEVSILKMITLILKFMEPLKQE